MTSDALPAAAETYLRHLREELAGTPPGTAAEIVEDVRAHLTGALADGRPLDQAIAGLGSPQAVAARARAEHVVPGRAPGDQRLRVLAGTVGVLTAVWVGVLLPAGEFRPGLAVLTVLIAVLPPALPARLRRTAGTVAAALVTAYLIIAFADAGMHYLPLVLLLWAAVIVPWRARHPRGPLAVRLWHLAAALLVILPGVLTASGSAGGSIGFDWETAVFYIALPTVLGLLCALRIRAAYAVAALIGTTAMIFALLDPGFLFLAFWWFGGLYLTVGAIGWVTTPARRPAPAATPARAA